MEWIDHHLNEESDRYSTEETPIFIQRESYNEEQKGDEPEIFVKFELLPLGTG
jgi:hypothetical protein